MDSIFSYVLATGVALLLIIGRVGYMRMKAAEVTIAAAIEKVMAQHEHGELLGQVAYQGGMPQLPKPTILYLALTKEKLLLFNQQNFVSEVHFCDWLKLDKFTIRQKDSKQGKSMVMLGPFASLFFRETLRHFIVIQYIDIDGEENHLLLELADQALHQQYYQKMFDCWQRYRQIYQSKKKQVATL